MTVRLYGKKGQMSRLTCLRYSTAYSNFKGRPRGPAPVCSVHSAGAHSLWTKQEVKPRLAG